MYFYAPLNITVINKQQHLTKIIKSNLAQENKCIVKPHMFYGFMFLRHFLQHVHIMKDSQII